MGVCLFLFPAALARCRSLLAKAWVPLLLVLLTAARVAGQVPDPTDPAPKPATEPATFKYTGQLTGTYSAGAVSRAVLNTAHALSYAKGRHFGVPFNGSFLYGKQNELLKERELVLNLTPYYRLNRFRAYGTGTYERSNLRGIRNRVQAGAGPGWAFYRIDSLGRELIISNLVLREATNFVDGSARTVTRNSLRAKITHGWRILTISSVTLYQPALNNLHDYRFSNTTLLNLHLTTRLALTANYTYSFEQRVLEEKNKGNTNLTVGISFRNAR